MTVSGSGDLTALFVQKIYEKKISFHDKPSCSLDNYPSLEIGVIRVHFLIVKHHAE